MSAGMDDLIPPDLALDTDHEPFDPELLDGTTGDPAYDEWMIEQLDEAQWAMAHVARLNAAEQEADHLAVGMQARLDAWHADQVERIRRRREFFVGKLGEFARARRAADSRAKTLRLPSGTVKTSERQARIKVADPEQVVAWAKTSVDPEQYDSVVRTEVVEKPIVAGLKALTHIKDDQVIGQGGDIVPGVTVEPAGVTWTVDTTDPEPIQ